MGMKNGDEKWGFPKNLGAFQKKTWMRPMDLMKFIEVPWIPWFRKSQDFPSDFHWTQLPSLRGD